MQKLLSRMEIVLSNQNLSKVKKQMKIITIWCWWINTLKEIRENIAGKSSRSSFYGIEKVESLHLKKFSNKLKISSLEPFPHFYLLLQFFESLEKFTFYHIADFNQATDELCLQLKTVATCKSILDTTHHSVN